MTTLDRRRALGLTLGALALPLAGCGGILPHPAAPPRLFQLRAPPRENLPQGPASAGRLLIAGPDAAYGLATQRIVLTRGRYGLDYFADAAWQDKAPAMVQSLIIESFQNTGRLAAVGRGAQPWSADYTLDTDILDFEAVYDDAMDPPRVLLRMGFVLTRSRDRSVAAHTDLSASAQAERNTVEAVVAAFDQAFGRISRDLVAWALPAMAG